MRRTYDIGLAILFVGLAAIAIYGQFDGDDPETETAGAAALQGRVVRVVDGDTIHVLVDGRREKVRYIGIDTPETHHPTKPVQCFGRAASGLNTRLVGNERVRLVRDVEERDAFGRLLAYVYRVRDGLFVNAELARRGYARPLTIAPDVRYAARFAALAREAREAGRGLWSAC
jgi:micrococcal nuclease